MGNEKLTTGVEGRPGKGWVLAMLGRKRGLRVALVPPARSRAAAFARPALTPWSGRGKEKENGRYKSQTK